MRSLYVFALAALVLGGCAPQSKTASAPPKPAPAAPIDPWMLTTLDASASEPAVLWNGLLGVRVARDGTGTSVPFFAIDEYDTTGEEKIRSLENPLAVSFRVGQEALDPKKGEGYEQSLDMGTGILRTKWDQTLGGKVLKIEVQTVIHPEKRILADRWTFTSKELVEVDGELKAYGKVTGSKQPGPEDLRLQTLAPPSNRKVVADLHAYGGSGAGQTRTHVSVAGDAITFHGVTGDGRPATFQRIFSFGRSPNWISMMAARGIAYKMRADWDNPAPVPKFADITKDCARIWGERWKTDIEIDGPKEDQQAVRSFLFYLQSAIHPEGDMSVSPMGLSNQQYNGHVFWDADIWVFPALVFVQPEAAAAIPLYRAATMDVAEDNFNEWKKGGMPTATGKVPVKPQAGEFAPGTMYPWESSVSGRETVPGPSKHQHHITGDVAFTAKMAADLGLFHEDLAGQILAGASTFFRHRTEGPMTGLELKGVMSPDEHHTGDNDLYTNLLAEWCLNGGKYGQARLGAHTGVHTMAKLPRDKETFLTYDNDILKSYKQAAAVLSIYPLQFPPAEKEAKKMMERFSDKVTKNGPAMSDSIHALIWARLGEKEKAYQSWKAGWEPFTNHPLMLFSEKRNRPITYFTTGAGGCLQAVIYGFLGLRIDRQKQEGAAWSTQLKGDAWLSIKPNLPSEWKSVKFKGFKVLGKSYTLTATQSGATVERGRESA